MFISDFQAITKTLGQMNYPSFVTGWCYKQYSKTVLQRVQEAGDGDSV